MTNKPVWLLDVDGVINACGLGHRAPKNSFTANPWRLVDGVAMGKTWPIRYSIDMIARINELSERCEIRWHTTWQHDAPALGKLLGLKPFKVEWDYQVEMPKHATQKMYGGFIPEPGAYKWWKMYHAVDVVLTEKRPLIWTDDDLGYEERKVFHKATDLDITVSTCLITPRTDTGLTEEDLNSIEQFISESS